MNALEKILEEIEHEIMTNKEVGRKQCEGMARAMNIIRSHMDDGKDINVHSNDNWTPTEERQPKKPVFGEDSYIVQTNNIITPFSAFWDGEEWTDVSDDKVKGVIAWQPLPKRYKGK